MTFLIEGCMPGEQEVVRFEVNAALHGGRIRGSALERHHGFNIETHQFPVQILQTPVICTQTHTHTHSDRESFMIGMQGEMSGAAVG